MIRALERCVLCAMASLLIWCGALIFADLRFPSHLYPSAQREGKVEREQAHRSEVFSETALP